MRQVEAVAPTDMGEADTMDLDLGKMVAAAAFASAITALAIVILSPLARRVGLTDRPGGRKQHEGQIPLIGGIAIFIGCTVGLSYSGAVIPGFHAFVTAISLLFVTGVVDDYLDVPALIKLAIQIGAALIMVYWGDLRIDGLANLFAPGPFYLGDFSAPFTVLAVVGYINAINMSDGIDGLAGSLTLVSALALLVAAYSASLAGETVFLTIFSATVFVFLIFNARHPLRAKAGIFLGDAGSLLCGFVIAWFVVHLAVVRPRAIDAATALWIVGVPFIDMIAVMVKRVLKGRSPFSADREHFHHLLLTAGFSVNYTVLIIAGLAAMFAFVGLIGQKLEAPGYVLFYLFVSVFMIAFVLLQFAWRATRLLARLRMLAGTSTEQTRRPEQ